MNQSKAKDQTLIIIFALSILLFGLDHQQVLNTPKDIILKVSSPLQYPFYFVRHKILDLLSEAKAIPIQQRRIKDLERRLSELSLKANKAEELQREIEVIKSNTKIKDTSGYSSVTAKVVSLTRFALINRGKTDGIKNGQAVIIGESLVGVIKSTLDHSSLVQLLKDQETQLDVITLGGTAGKLKYSDNSLTIEEILQKNPLNLEEPVLTKGSENMPDGLLVGYITKVEEKPSSVYKQAHLDQANDITDQSYVIVATR
jgi:rod shape-determining protein MreC